MTSRFRSPKIASRAPRLVAATLFLVLAVSCSPKPVGPQENAIDFIGMNLEEIEAIFGLDHAYSSFPTDTQHLPSIYYNDNDLPYVFVFGNLKIEGNETSLTGVAQVTLLWLATDSRAFRIAPGVLSTDNASSLARSRPDGVLYEPGELMDDYEFYFEDGDVGVHFLWNADSSVRKHADRIYVESIAL